MSKKKPAKFTDLSGTKQIVELEKALLESQEDSDEFEDSDDDEFPEIPPIESELAKDIDIALPVADTKSILTCLTHAREYHEDMGSDDSADAESKDFRNESVAILLKIIAKITAAKSACLTATYIVRLTFWELDNLLGALEGEIDMQMVETEAVISSKKKYYDTLEAVFDLIQPAHIARYAAIWPNTTANPKTTLQ